MEELDAQEVEQEDPRPQEEQGKGTKARDKEGHLKERGIADTPLE